MRSCMTGGLTQEGFLCKRGLSQRGTIREHRLIEYFQSVTKEGVEMFSENCCASRAKLLILNGGQRRDRTADAGLFRAALYH